MFYANLRTTKLCAFFHQNFAENELLESNCLRANRQVLGRLSRPSEGKGGRSRGLPCVVDFVNTRASVRDGFREFWGSASLCALPEEEEAAAAAEAEAAAPQGGSLLGDGGGGSRLAALDERQLAYYERRMDEACAELFRFLPGLCALSPRAAAQMLAAGSDKLASDGSGGGGGGGGGEASTAAAVSELRKCQCHTTHSARTPPFIPTSCMCAPLHFTDSRPAPDVPCAPLRHAAPHCRRRGLRADKVRAPRAAFFLRTHDLRILEVRAAAGRLGEEGALRHNDGWRRGGVAAGRWVGCGAAALAARRADRSSRVCAHVCWGGALRAALLRRRRWR